MTTIERTCKKCRKPFTAETWHGEVLGFAMSLTELMCPACRNVGTDRVANFKPEMLELDSLIGKTVDEAIEDATPVWIGKNF